jgi:predicted permease
MKEEKFLFQRENYILFGIGLAFIILGFILMTGGGSDNPQIYNEELFNSRRIIFSPLLIVVGFVIEVFAILRRPKS